MGPNPFAGNFEDPLARTPPAVPPRTNFFRGHRAVLAIATWIRAVPLRHASACESAGEYLNLGLHFSALHFCISPLGVHFSQHFTSCTYFTFLHFTPCTYFPARHFTSCTHSSALPFLHLLSCTLSWSGVPPGVKFPPEGGSCRDFPHEGGSFPGVGSRKELSFLLK